MNTRDLKKVVKVGITPLIIALTADILFYDGESWKNLQSYSSYTEAEKAMESFLKMDRYIEG